MVKENALSFGDKIKGLRESANWSQTKLSNESGVSQANISRIESDPTANVSVQTKKNLLDVLTKAKGNEKYIKLSNRSTTFDKDFFNKFEQLSGEKKILLYNVLSDMLDEN